MLKKIIISIGITILLSIIGGYLYFANYLYNKNINFETCKVVKVQLLDSAVNRFVTQNEVREIIDEYFGKHIGKKVEEIDLNLVEELLNKRSAIKYSQASITRDGIMNINITQRKPILRIQTENGGFYVDEEKYIFPLVSSFTSYVPIVSGKIPFTINSDHRGLAIEDNNDWMGKVLDLGYFLNYHPFWNAQIEQIYVGTNGDIYLSPRVGNHKIILGDLNNIEIKFKKLYAFYKTIIPVEGWDKYSSVNVKYDNQIVCVLKEKQNKELNNNQNKAL